MRFFYYLLLLGFVLMLSGCGALSEVAMKPYDKANRKGYMPPSEYYEKKAEQQQYEDKMF